MSADTLAVRRVLLLAIEQRKGELRLHRDHADLVAADINRLERELRAIDGAERIELDIAHQDRLLGRGS